MEDTALIISAISLIFSICLGIWNIKIAKENHAMRKDEFYRIRNKEAKEIFDLRPKLITTKYVNNISGTEALNQADIECLVLPFREYKEVKTRQLFIYDEKLLKKEEWVSLYFEFENKGRSPIDHLYVSYNDPKQTSMFDARDDQHLNYVKNELLNYSVFYEDKLLEPGSSISLKINFHKSLVGRNFISAEVSVWLFDQYGTIWEQPLFIHNGKIYDSHKVTFEQFKDNTNVESALKCFREPYLW